MTRMALGSPAVFLAFGVNRGDDAEGQAPRAVALALEHPLVREALRAVERRPNRLIDVPY